LPLSGTSQSARNHSPECVGTSPSNEQAVFGRISPLSTLIEFLDFDHVGQAGQVEQPHDLFGRATKGEAAAEQLPGPDQDTEPGRVHERHVADVDNEVIGDDEP
jgi:hypothetical protein